MSLKAALALKPRSLARRYLDIFVSFCMLAHSLDELTIYRDVPCHARFTVRLLSEEKNHLLTFFWIAIVVT